MDLLNLQNNQHYYNLKKLAVDLKQDLKHMKATGIDPRAFLGGTFNDCVSRIEALVELERHHVRN